MEFSKFDASLMVVMTMAIIFMSFVMPAAGLVSDNSDTNVTNNDIPSFDFDANRFDLAGSFPDAPGTPDSGSLYYDHNDTERSDYQRTVGSGKNTTANFAMYKRTADPQGTLYVTLNVFDSNGNLLAEDNQTTTTEGDYIKLSAGKWQVEFDITTLNSSHNIFASDYEVTARDNNDGDGGWLESIPVIGVAADYGSTLAAHVAWLGSIIFWFVGTTVEIILNLVGLLFDTFAFALGLTGYLVNTYLAIVASAQDFATVFTAIPGVILSILFAKLGFVGVSLLPTT